jgi:TatD DNase family protein
VVAESPLSSLVLETDCPYLAPVPYRGKRNEPGYLPIIARRVAEVKGAPLEEVAETTRSAAAGLLLRRAAAETREPAVGKTVT